MAEETKEAEDEESEDEEEDEEEIPEDFNDSPEFSSQRLSSKDLVLASAQGEQTQELSDIIEQSAPTTSATDKDNKAAYGARTSAYLTNNKNYGAEAERDKENKYKAPEDLRDLRALQTNPLETSNLRENVIGRGAPQTQITSRTRDQDFTQASQFEDFQNQLRKYGEQVDISADLSKTRRRLAA